MFDYTVLSGKDHPRPRGEKPAVNEGDDEVQGSPPPTRGKEILSHKGAYERRITPAHAGKSTVIERARIEAEDHPRPRGEKAKKTPKYRHFRFSNQPISFSFS